MAKKILIIDGHPDKDPARFSHALTNAYAEGAREAGHEVRTLKISEIDFPVLRSPSDWEKGKVPASLEESQAAISWADHIVIIYPLFLGDVPALLKAFLEQVMRPGFALEPLGKSLSPGKLKGKSAHIIVTMGMPGIIYKLYFFKHSVRSLKRNILQFVGMKPVRDTVIGSIGQTDTKKWLKRVFEMGRKGV